MFKDSLGGPLIEGAYYLRGDLLALVSKYVWNKLNTNENWKPFNVVRRWRQLDNMHGVRTRTYRTYPYVPYVPVRTVRTRTYPWQPPPRPRQLYQLFLPADWVTVDPT